jgi:MerR family transcriptional regulator, thiopeptide resistance regulator
MYKVSEFAEAAGVTVRALHHYDRLGLLKPSGRTGSGYRLYGERDLARLQQIVTLKFIGLPLKEIKALLVRGNLDLAATLRLQRRLLTEKRRQLDVVIQALDEAERSARSGGAPGWAALKRIIEVMEMQNDMNWTKKYYSEEAQAKIAERSKLWSPELQEKVSQDWQNLVRDVEAAVAAGEKPAGAKAQALAGRWSELVRGFTGGDAEIQKGLNKMYADRQNWPASLPRYFTDEVQAFIMKAMEAAKK